MLLRLTVFIDESGYSELAIATWQALLEYSFCAPCGLNSMTERVEHFKEFWESEVPRIGEDGSFGWRYFCENGETSATSETLVDGSDTDLDDTDLFRSWTRAEQARNRASRTPARTEDEVVEDDPFRVILFSDIEKFLVALPPPSKSGALYLLLLDLFLLFCRLPPITNSELPISREWSNDPFIGEATSQVDSEILRQEFSNAAFGEATDDAHQSIESILRTFPQNFQNSSDELFSGCWFKRLKAWKDLYSGDNGPFTYKMVRNILKRLVQMPEGDHLAEYYLAFEWINEPQTVKKVAKTLLKQFPLSLRLYNA